MRRNIWMLVNLSPTDAGCFAGKSGFFVTTCVGHVGCAATKLVLARQRAEHHLCLHQHSRSLLVSVWRRTHNLARHVFSACSPVVRRRVLPPQGQRYRGILENNVAVRAHLEHGFGAIHFPVSEQPVFFHCDLHTEVNSCFSEEHLYKCTRCSPFVTSYWRRTSADSTAAQFALSRACFGWSCQCARVCFAQQPQKEVLRHGEHLGPRRREEASGVGVTHHWEGRGVHHEQEGEGEVNAQKGRERVRA